MTRTTPIVWLIAQPTVPKHGGKFPNLAPMAEWGEIHVLVEAGDYPTHKPKKIYDQVYRRLSGNYNEQLDYFVWAGGDALSAVMVGSVLRQLGYVKFRWLRFDRATDEEGSRSNVDGVYTPVEIWLTTTDPEGETKSEQQFTRYIDRPRR